VQNRTLLQKAVLTNPALAYSLRELVTVAKALHFAQMSSVDCIGTSTAAVSDLDTTTTTTTTIGIANQKPRVVELQRDALEYALLCSKGCFSAARRSLLQGHVSVMATMCFTHSKLAQQMLAALCLPIHS
jgi:hypothetical protein